MPTNSLTSQGRAAAARVTGGPRLRRFFADRPEQAPTLNKLTLVGYEREEILQLIDDFARCAQLAAHFPGGQTATREAAQQIRAVRLDLAQFFDATGGGFFQRVMRGGVAEKAARPAGD